MDYLDFKYKNKDTEFKQIKAFLTDLQYFENHDNNWDPSRLDWWRYSYHHDKDEDFFVKNAHYWTTTTGEIVGLAISEYGKNDIFIIVHPNHQSLYELVITWCKSIFGQYKTEIVTTIFLNDLRKIEKLEASGFIRTRHENNVRTYNLVDYDFEYTLPSGFTIVPFPEYLNFESKIELICNAFDKPEHSKERILSFMETPGYMPDLDLVVLNSEHKCVAYCTGWTEQYDESLGYIEPMGTHSDYRRLGLASALAKECFKRLKEKGVKSATIASNAEPDISNCLYDSLQPSAKKSGYDYIFKL
ncbi:MAG: GNAT family N-acetyltransferase [Clostridiales bacterium]|nr:GNAT family N-acetyltransferase [Clostridiales bacterium]